MVFSSPTFLFFFFPAVYLIYQFLPGMGAKNLWLAFASLVFFSFGQLTCLPLLLLSVVCNYLFGLWLQKGRCRKLAVGLAVAVNLGILGVFKYADFLIATVNAVTGLALSPLGLELPIGISFFTFQGLSYVIDVYRVPESGAKRLDKLLLYIAFFPQLIAGPIVIYHDIAAQIDSRAATPEDTLAGLRRLIQGMGKKLLVADTMGRAADAVFAMTAGELDARLAWLGAVCYALQIYFDFSGYSDMAIGLGRVFGFHFRENFDLPYIAKSNKEFWRRWHISLSSWFRDYLYIPLGGNREGKKRTFRNKLIVFFATGLWHGANWTFVLWGLWHGLFSTLEDWNVIPQRLRKSVFGHVYELLVVVLGFVLFRADSVAAAGVMWYQMFFGFRFTAAHTLALRALLDPRTVFFLLAGAALALGLPQRLARALSRKTPRVMATASRLAWCGLFAVCFLNMVSSTFSPFIYFQF